MFDEQSKQPNQVFNSKVSEPLPEKKEEPKPAENKQPAVGEVYTMPMEYYLGKKTVNSAKGLSSAKVSSSQASKPNKKGITILVVVILILLFGASLFLLYKTYLEPAPAVNNQVVAPESETVREQTPVVQEEETPAPEVIEETPTVETPATVENEFDLTKTRDQNLAILGSLDSDKDGLTDAEEDLLGLNKSLIDTDSDSYADAEEIENFYSPADKEKVKLSDWNFIKSYANAKYGYNVLYPSVWLLDSFDPTDPKEVMITAANNEFVNIIVEEKPNTENISDWYKRQNPGLDTSSVKFYRSYNKLNVMESPDGFTRFIDAGDKVYILNYNIGLKEEADYPNLFKMIVNSFEIIP